MNLELQLTAGLFTLCTTTLLLSHATQSHSAQVAVELRTVESEEVPVEVASVTPASPMVWRFGWQPPQPGEVAVELTPVVPAPENAVVEIAICLDTSGSMDGLIDSAKQKLWAIMNEFIFAEPAPTLRVALLTYGNDGHNPEDGWVKLETGLTEDLDLVFERLFAQTTNGGTELVGRVVNSATGQLDWSDLPGALKLIIVAGNETADQDQVVSFRQACGAAIAQDIMVNAIYCGAPGDPDAESWRQVARLADGQFAAIDQGLGALAIATPFDASLATLSTELNDTYLAYGTQGAWGLNNQVVQDSNVAGLNSEAAATRAHCKANGLYNCASWDLVDAVRLQTVVLADVKTEDLPEVMQSMTLEQRGEHIAAMQEKRSAVQAKVNDLAAQRSVFVHAEQLKQQQGAELSLDRALTGAIRNQAEAKGYRFTNEEVPAPAAVSSDAPQGVAPATQSFTAPAGQVMQTLNGSYPQQGAAQSGLQSGVQSGVQGAVPVQRIVSPPVPYATPATGQQRNSPVVPKQTEAKQAPKVLEGC